MLDTSAESITGWKCRPIGHTNQSGRKRTNPVATFTRSGAFVPKCFEAFSAPDAGDKYYAGSAYHIAYVATHTDDNVREAYPGATH